ncbi:MAG: type IV secretory system conjugative DNA transfer family protein [Nakamurella sp.]
MHQYGPRLGELVDRTRPELRQTFEDSTIAVAPPRGHKTAAVAIPRVLDAPGPIVATSTKADLLLNTCTPRALVGAVWVLDAEGIADPMAPSWRTLQWDLVRGCEDAEVAIRRASALVAAKPLGAVRNSDFFSGKAAGVLRCWLMAAAVGHRSVRDIPRWLHNLSDPTPANILDAVNLDWAQRLRALPRNTAGEMVGGIVGTLELLLSPLDSPRIAAACEPREGHGFEIGEFLASSDSVYLLTEGQEHGAAPFVTALVDEIMHHARRLSQRSVGQRLDPPLTVVLDEPANTAALPAMPQYMSDSGGRGIALCLLPQGWAQMRRRWGDDGAKEIWNSATAAMVMGGGKESDFLEDISRLVGDHRRSETSTTSGGGVFGGLRMSRQRSERWDRTLKLNDLREITDGHALLLYQRLPPAIIELPTWWKGSQAKQLQAGADAIQASRVGAGVIT